MYAPPPTLSLPDPSLPNPSPPLGSDSEGPYSILRPLPVPKNLSPYSTETGPSGQTPPATTSGITTPTNTLPHPTPFALLLPLLTRDQSGTSKPSCSAQESPSKVLRREPQLPTPRPPEEGRRVGGRGPRHEGTRIGGWKRVLYNIESDLTLLRPPLPDPAREVRPPGRGSGQVGKVPPRPGKRPTQTGGSRHRPRSPEGRNRGRGEELREIITLYNDYLFDK